MTDSPTNPKLNRAARRAEASVNRRQANDKGRDRDRRQGRESAVSPKDASLKRQTKPMRGNTLVLVMGILVLLVIIATAYVSRTQAGRSTSSAIQRVGLEQDTVRNIGGDISEMIANALFVQAIPRSYGIPADQTELSNTILDILQPAETRYGFDFDPFFAVNYPWNFAPYQVVPWTNWPDPIATSGLDPNFWPPLNPTSPPGAIVNTRLLEEGNPPGFPGFGDCRWLRDLEPLRWDTTMFSGSPYGVLDAYSHWRHLTNIARANNGWRAVGDISDVENSLITNLEIPIEQWLAILPNNLNPATGDPVFPDAVNPVTGQISNQTQLQFWKQWRTRFGTTAPLGLGAYALGLSDPTLIPNNHYRLSNLYDVNLTSPVNDQIGERPQDEFIRGTPRWYVGCVLADTDGDGYTDAYWFLAPTSVQGGIRQLVAMSIIDNQGMLNANVATRFFRSDLDFSKPVRTKGLGPMDLALVGQLFGIANTSLGQQHDNFNVGYFDNPDHQYVAADPVNAATYNGGFPFGYLETNWDRYLDSVRLPNNNATEALTYLTQADRLDYWRRAASNPLSMDHAGKYIPFDLSSELELRMFAGENYPWSFSRFEYAVQAFNATANERFLRANTGREETSEYKDQLINRDLVADKRKFLTLYNGVRNDLMPPWLWVFGSGIDLNGDGLVNGLDQAIFERGMQKFDLRMPWLTPIVGGTEVIVGGIESVVGDLTTYDNLGNQLLTNQTTAVARFDRAGATFGVALRDRLERALMDGLNLNYPPAFPRDTYFGPAASSVNEGVTVNRTRELAAVLAANAIQWRDTEDRDPTFACNGQRIRQDDVAYISDAVPVAPDSNGVNPGILMLGVEPQPFIAEAFVAHAYKFIPVNPCIDPTGDMYTNCDEYVAFEDLVGTVVVVQIANPFNVPIDLRNYKLSAFGQTIDLATIQPEPGQQISCPLWLGPATNNKPTTAIFYAMTDTVDGDAFKSKWVNFLDLQVAGVDGVPNNLDDDLTPDTIVRDVSATAAAGANAWSVDRTTYDDDTTEGTIVLSRKTPVDPSATGGFADVVVDRIDPPADRKFGNEVRNMRNVKNSINVAFNGPFVNSQLPGQFDVLPPGEPYPGATTTFTVDGRNYWAQWVRAVRPWGIDLNRDGVYDDNEKNPRFVFGDRAVVKPIGTTGNDDGSFAKLFSGTSDEGLGNRFKFLANPDDVVNAALGQGWFGRFYYRADGLRANNTAMDPVTNMVIPFHKPTFFDMNGKQDPSRIPSPFNPSLPTYPTWSYPDKGWYGQSHNGTGDPGPDDDVFITGGVADVARNYPMQMLQKNGDLEQTGELLNLWVVAHKIQNDNSVDPPVIRTLRTFSEGLSDTNAAGPTKNLRSGRLQLGAVIGVGDAANLADVRHAVPDLPATVRIFDAFVCDGLGVDPGTDATNDPPTHDLNGDGLVNAGDVAWRLSLRFSNAKGFDGSGTPGLININTAPVEVMRSLPNWYRLVHETGGLGWAPNWLYYTNFTGGNGQTLVATGSQITTNTSGPSARDPRVMLPEALTNMRERFNGDYPSVADPTGYPRGPYYGDRNLGPAPIHGDRGVVSPGELLLLQRPAHQQVPLLVPAPGPAPMTWPPQGPNALSYDYIYDGQWMTDMGTVLAAADQTKDRPFWHAPPNTGTPRKPVSVMVSTDTDDEFSDDCDNNGVMDAMQIAQGAADANHDGIPDLCQPAVDRAIVPMQADHVVGDAEESTMLFSGASNMITTRSDTFTVYFRVRSFRQTPNGPNGPVWDATNPEYIVDDSRYVMLVDRSTVNHPGDKPRILYLEKLSK